MPRRRFLNVLRRLKWLLTLSYTVVAILAVLLVAWWAFFAISVYLARADAGMSVLQVLQTRLMPVLGVIMPSMLLLIIPAAAVSAYFGFLAARWIDGRLSRIQEATRAWRQGDFSVKVQDDLPDEIGKFGQDLNRMAREFEVLLYAQQDLAALEERYRLAGELHDSVKQQMTAAMFQISAAQALLDSDPPAARASLQHAADLTHAAQKEMSAIIFELRPAALEGRGLAAAVRKYVEEWSQQFGAPVTLRIEGEGALTPELERVVFRLIQEALSNVARHSQAQSASVRLVFLPDRLEVEVADQGIGFQIESVHSDGFGLESMAARIHQVGGAMVIDSQPGQGTRLIARIPLAEGAQGV